MREARGLTQAELAQRIGKHQPNIARLESGRFEPSLRTALALAVALDTTVEDLFGPAGTVIHTRQRDAPATPDTSGGTTHDRGATST